MLQLLAVKAGKLLLLQHARSKKKKSGTRTVLLSCGIGKGLKSIIVNPLSFSFLYLGNFNASGEIRTWDSSRKQGKLQRLVSFQEKGADTSRYAKREEEGKNKDSKFGLLIGVLLIYRDTINSSKSSRGGGWGRVRTARQSGEMQEETYWSINPRTSHEASIMLARSLRFALQQGHCSKRTYTLKYAETQPQL